MLKYLVLLIPAAALAADPAGFVVWKSAELKGMEKKLAPKIDAQKVATQQLENYGNHSTMVAHREGDGQAEQGFDDSRAHFGEGLHERHAQHVLIFGKRGHREFLFGLGISAPGCGGAYE